MIINIGIGYWLFIFYNISQFTNDNSNVMIDAISGALVINNYTIIGGSFDCNATNTAGFDVDTIPNITLSTCK